MKKEFSPSINEGEELEKVKEIFLKNKEELASKKYMSVYSEAKRHNKLFMSFKIKAPIDKVFKAMLNIAAKDMHANLKPEDIKEGGFYYSSGKSNNTPFTISEFKENEKISIEWIANNTYFSKSLTFKSNKKNTVTKIKYMDIVIASDIAEGWLQRHSIGVYTKRQALAFQIQCKKAIIDLELVSPIKQHKLIEQIENMIKYSKSLY